MRQRRSGSAVARAQQFQKGRQRPARHQRVGAEQGRGDRGRQQRAPLKPAAEAVAFIEHLVGGDAEQDSGRGRGDPDRDPGRQPRRPGPAAQGQPGRAEHENAQRHAASHLQLPERIVADGLAGRVFHRALHGIDQAPIAADGALELAFPRLVVGLDQIDAEVFPLRQIAGFPRRPAPDWCATAARLRASAPALGQPVSPIRISLPGNATAIRLRMASTWAAANLARIGKSSQ